MLFMLTLNKIELIHRHKQTDRQTDRQTDGLTYLLKWSKEEDVFDGVIQSFSLLVRLGINHLHNHTQDNSASYPPQ